jgi:hypothetical protein
MRINYSALVSFTLRFVHASMQYANVYDAPLQRDADVFLWGGGEIEGDRLRIYRILIILNFQKDVEFKTK